MINCKSKDKNSESSSVGLIESVLEKIKRNEAERDRVLVDYYKSMMRQKDMAYSQAQMFQLALNYLLLHGYTSITSISGVRKRLIKLGVIKTK